MKFTISREAFLSAAQLVIGVVERKQTLPILANVLIEVSSDNILKMTGTDLEVELVSQTALPSPAKQAGKITVPGRKLVDICRALPEHSEIEFSVESHQAILRAARSRFVLSTLTANDFPNIDEHDEQLKFQIPKKDFLYLLQKTHFSMAQQDVRYYLNGLLLEASKGALRAVATDGHRLATTQITAKIEMDHRLQIIVPRKGVLELMRLLSNQDELIDVVIGNNHIRIITPGFTFTSKLVEGRFPDYQRVIPKKCDTAVTLQRDELKQALTRVAILCNEKFRGVRFELENNALTIEANNPEQEVAEEELSVEYSDKPLEIAFNVTYLLDILNTMSAAKVKFGFVLANKSTLIEAVDPQDHCLFVVMPMRL